MSTWVNHGYECIDFTVGGKKHRQYVHRMVAKAFLADSWFDGATVDHVDANRSNNRPENLQWTTIAENTRRQNAAGRGAPKGELHPLAKLKNSDVPKLLEMRAQGLSLSKIGAHFGVSGSLVHKVTNKMRRAAS